jgi:predicted Zn-dependent protease
MGAIAGQVLGAMSAGALAASSPRAQFARAYFMKFSRGRREADLMGAQIMARAGYDPLQMANMFRRSRSR